MINLKEKRKNKGLTQQQLADKVYVTRQIISAYETGRTRPSIESAKLLGEVLDFEWPEIYR